MQIDFRTATDAELRMVCGWAPTLCGVHGPGARDVIRMFGMLQPYVTDSPVATYSKLCQALKVRQNPKFIRFCEANEIYLNEERQRLADSDNSNPLTAEPSEAATILDMSSQYIGVKGSIAMIATLPVCRVVGGINVSKCDLDSTLVALLARVCHSQFLPALRVINVSHNPFGSIGAFALAELASASPNLLEIDVDGVEMIAAVHRRLCSALYRNAVASGWPPQILNRAADEATPSGRPLEYLFKSALRDGEGDVGSLEALNALMEVGQQYGFEYSSSPTAGANCDTTNAEKDDHDDGGDDNPRRDVMVALETALQTLPETSTGANVGAAHQVASMLPRDDGTARRAHSSPIHQQSSSPGTARRLSNQGLRSGGHGEDAAIGQVVAESVDLSSLQWIGTELARAGST